MTLVSFAVCENARNSASALDLVRAGAVAKPSWLSRRQTYPWRRLARTYRAASHCGRTGHVSLHVIKSVRPTPAGISLQPGCPQNPKFKLNTIIINHTSFGLAASSTSTCLSRAGNRLTEKNLHASAPRRWRRLRYVVFAHLNTIFASQNKLTSGPSVPRHQRANLKTFSPLQTTISSCILLVHPPKGMAWLLFWTRFVFCHFRVPTSHFNSSNISKSRDDNFGREGVRQTGIERWRRWLGSLRRGTQGAWLRLRYHDVRGVAAEGRDRDERRD